MLWLIVPSVVMLLVLWFKHRGRSCGEAVQYLVFLRYQLSLAFLMFCFPLIARSGRLEKYFGNLLAVEDLKHLAVITFFCFLATVPLVLAIELTLRYGPPRFKVAAPSDYLVSNRYFVYLTGRFCDRDRTVGVLHMLRFVFAVLLSLPITFEVAQSAKANIETTWLNIVGVVLLSYAAGAWFVRVALFIRNKCVSSPPVVDIFYVYLDLPLWLLNKSEHRLLQKNTRHLQKDHLAQSLGEAHALSGYRPRDIDKAPSEWIKRWYPGHISGAFLFVACAIIFLCVIFFYDPSRDIEQSFPPLGYVLLLFTLWSWLLPAAAFFFDRWRLPVPMLLLALWAGLSWCFSGDHYYAVTAVAKNKPQTAAPTDAAATETQSAGSLTAVQATRQWILHDSGHGSRQVVVIVMAAGGGIVASAWTSEVLTELESTFREKFTDRLLAISSVSGGSVGTLYYMLDFKRGAVSQSLTQVTRAARSSSLSATAWGVVARDFWRFLYPYERDRATALEQAWRNAWMRLSSDESRTWPTLRRWRSMVRTGDFPIVFFNTTSVETGSPYLFTPVDVKPIFNQAVTGEGATTYKPTALRNRPLGQRSPPPPFAGFGNFVEEYPNHDVECVTAARLSATFPWVTPVARAAPVTAEDPITHLADGGYFDNFGITTLAEYLLATSSTLESNGIRKIILIDISPWSRGSATVAAARDSHFEMVFMQAQAPLATLFKARGTSQAGRAASEIHLLQDALPDAIELVHFPVYMDEYVGRNDFRVPMSWHLARKEALVFDDARKNLTAISQPTDQTTAVAQPPQGPGKTKIDEPRLRKDWVRLRELLNGGE
jgi:Patatin-like phospholipase